jgi:hypothetical protein
MGQPIFVMEDKQPEQTWKKLVWELITWKDGL